MAFPGKTVENPTTGQRLRFITTRHESEGRELVIESSYKKRSTEPLLHYHPQQEEVFEVVRGQLTVRLDNLLHNLQPGQQLRIAPGQTHSMWNDIDQPTTVRWTTRPAMRTEEFLETAFGLAQDGLVRPDGTPSLLQASLLTREFAAEYRLAGLPRWVQRLVFGLLRPVAKASGLRGIYAHYIGQKPRAF